MNREGLGELHASTLANAYYKNLIETLKAIPSCHSERHISAAWFLFSWQRLFVQSQDNLLNPQSNNLSFHGHLFNHVSYAFVKDWNF